MWLLRVASATLCVVLCSGQYQPPPQQYQPAQPYQSQPYQAAQPYANYSSGLTQYGNYSASGPQYPPALGPSGPYGNNSMIGQYQGDPWSAQWDNEHRYRQNYNPETLAWINANLETAWNAAKNIVDGKENGYNGNQGQCGYSANSQNNYEMRNQYRADAMIQVAQWLWDNYPGNKLDLHNAGRQVDAKQFYFLQDCMAENYNPWQGTCGQYDRYSRPDQMCNNPNFPTWGAYHDICERITDKWNYENGVWQATIYHVWPNYDGTRSPLMPISQVTDIMDGKADCYQFDTTMMHAYFQQFITHDIIRSKAYKVQSYQGHEVTPSCCGIDPNCMHHSCQSYNPETQNYHTGGYGGCDNVADNAPAIDYCRPIAKDPVNIQTAYIDGSGVYGATCARATHLRAFRKGKLRVNKGYYGLYSRHITLPDDLNPNPENCDTSYTTKDLKCLKAGDDRVMQHAGLTMMHVIWMRIHNRLTSSCSKYLEKYYLSDDVLDEICYQETRRIIQGIIQTIFYRDHLAISLGPYIAGDPKWKISLNSVVPWNPNVHASVWPEYVYAAGRMHTVVAEWTQIQNPSKAHLQPPESWYKIYEYLGRSYQLVYSKNKGNELLANALYDPEQCYDSSFVPAMRGSWDGAPKGAIDMMSRNFYRNRVGGMPWYTELREWCGESPVYDWAQGESIWNEHCMKNLPQVYGHPKNVEGYIGLICERPMPGASVGPTAGCILQRQYQNLREGDRWFHDRVGWSYEQLSVIRKFNLGKLLCITTNLDYVTENVLRTPNAYSNKYVSCNTYDDITEDDLYVLWNGIPTTAGDYRTCKDYGASGYSNQAMGSGGSYQNSTYQQPQYQQQYGNNTAGQQQAYQPPMQQYGNNSYGQAQQQGYVAAQGYVAPQQPYVAPVQTVYKEKTVVQTSYGK